MKKTLILWRRPFLKNYSSSPGIAINWHILKVTKKGSRTSLKVCPNLTKKFQWKVYKVVLNQLKTWKWNWIFSLVICSIHCLKLHLLQFVDNQKGFDYISVLSPYWPLWIWPINCKTIVLSWWVQSGGKGRGHWPSDCTPWHGLVGWGVNTLVKWP